MSKIKIDGFSSAIISELSKYNEATAAGVKKAVKKMARDVKSELTQTSPKKTGDYAKEWTIKTQRETSTAISIVVHDKKYQLTHLLEKGHAKRNGGRVPAYEHIKPAEEKAADKLVKEIEKVL